MRSALFVCLLLLPVAAAAAVHHVPSDYATIQAGIDAAAEGDTVLVGPGTYSGAGNNNLNCHGKNLTVAGNSGYGYTFLEGDRARDTRAFVFNAGEIRQCRIWGFTVRGFTALDFGGAIWISGASPTLENLLFEDCGSSVYGDVVNGGGAVACGNNGNPLLLNCAFERCAYDYGGAIYISSSAVEIRGCRFEECTAVDGGAIYVSSSTGSVAVSTTLFDRCRTELMLDYHGEHWGGRGGAAAIGGSALFEDCRFVSCSSAWAWDTDTGGRGGALCGGQITVRRGLFEACYGRTAGAICGGPGLMLERITVTDCDSDVGALNLEAGAAVSQAIVASNDGPGLCAAQGVSITCSDVWGNEGGNYAGDLGDQTGIGGNISADPVFCTDHYSPETPFGLSAGSPCAAANNSCGLTMGCYDVSCVIADYTISGHVTAPDGGPFAGVTIDGAYGGSVTTDANGNYGFIVPWGWAGTLRPLRPGYAFTPTTRVYAGVDADQPDQNFTSTLMHRIRGHVVGLDGEPVMGVLMAGAPETSYSDWWGTYECIVPDGWSGTIVPTKEGWGFDPAQREYSNLQEDLITEDYAAWLPWMQITLHRVPQDQPHLQAALALATPGDSILVAPGVYSGIGNRDLSWPADELLLYSVAGSAGTIIDLEQGGRFLTMRDTGNASCIAGFTVRNGCVTEISQGGCGGGLYIQNAAPLLRDLVIEGCAATGGDGGGIHLRESNARLEDVVLRGNSILGASGQGGGLYSANGSPVLQRVLIANNSAALNGGGAMIEHGGVLNLAQVTIAGNTCTWEGGGLFCALGGAIYASGSVVYGNTAGYGGGGIAPLDPGDEVLLECSNVLGNLPDDFGGGMEDPTGQDGNIAADPRFCDVAAGDFGLLPDSPCLPWNNDCGIQMGAYGLGCGDTPVALASFTATPAAGAVDLTWEADELADFRLTGTRDAASWNVAWQAAGSGRFHARDECEQLAPGGEVSYRLEGRLAGEDWQLLRELAVTLPPAFATRLLEPHPNPFNPVVTLPFTLAAPGRVRLEVFDLAGRRIATLADGHFEAGEQALVWDGRDEAGNPQASGVYFARLAAAGITETKRLVLLR